MTSTPPHWTASKYTLAEEKLRDSQSVDETVISADILDSYPEFASTARLDELRKTEYAYLDEQDHVYLDYTGAGLAARAQHRAHADRLATTLFGNPHSVSPTSNVATSSVQEARRRILKHFGASPDEYSVIFTANATAAARLVGEAYAFDRRTRLVMTTDNHNSVNGLREFARRRHAKVAYVASTTDDLRVGTKDVVRVLSNKSARSCLSFPSLTGRKKHRGLFAFPAQSNFSGVRHPLEWVSLAQNRGYRVLLDAAAFLPTASLDLSGDVKPDFVLVSWYKLFGYPTGVGCLIARHDALASLRRPWFSGGTIQAVAVRLPKWHIMAGDEAAFEDGTLNFLAIPDVSVGLDWLDAMDMEVIGRRVRCLTGWFLDRLSRLRHSDGRPMVLMYGPKTTEMRGPTVTFNFLDAAGKIVDERLVAMESAAARISLRTGCFCNPGCGEDAFGLQISSLIPLLWNHTRAIDDYVRVIGLPSAGAVRVSFGVASNVQDVDRFFNWAQQTYKDRVTSNEGLPPRTQC